MPGPASALRQKPLTEASPEHLTSLEERLRGAAPQAIGLEEFEKDAAEIMELGGRIFPSADYGWGRLVRAPGTLLYRDHIRDAGSGDVREGWVFTWRRRISRYGRVTPGFMCQDGAAWLYRQFLERGYNPRIVVMQSPLWAKDLGIEVNGRRFVLTPGTDPERPSVQVIGHEPGEAFGQDWLEQRTQFDVFTGGEYHPMAFREVGGNRVLASAGVGENKAGDILVAVSVSLRDGEGVVQDRQVQLAIPLNGLTKLQRQFRSLGPQRVRERYRNIQPEISTSDRPLSPTEKRAMTRVLGENLDLFYHLVTKMNIVVPPQPSVGLEEKRLTETLAQLAEAAQGPGVLVLGPQVAEERPAVAELLRRAPELADRVIFFGWEAGELEELRKIPRRITAVDAWDYAGLVAALLGWRESDRVGVLGDPELADYLDQVLPESIQVTPLLMDTPFRAILGALGIPDGVLDQVDADALEGQLAKLWAA